MKGTAEDGHLFFFTRTRLIYSLESFVFIASVHCCLVFIINSKYGKWHSIHNLGFDQRPVYTNDKGRYKRKQHMQTESPSSLNHESLHAT